MTASTNGRPKDVTELRQEIQRTRADLGDTVEALAAKADVKARARDAVEDVKLRARAGIRQAGHDAVEVSREFRAHPLEQAQVTVARLRHSVREHPAPWIVGAAFLLLAGLITARNRR
jgi:hypothetical protein